MIPIYLHGPLGDRGYLFKQFSQHLQQICEEHHAHNRAAAFVFILHDLTNPALMKALDDPSYWAALDEISGNVLSVFSVHEALVQRLHRPRDESVRSIRDVTEKGQEFAESYFGLPDTRMPALLFFQVSNNLISDFALIELEADTPDKAFNEIRAILSACADCLRDSTGRIIRNPEESFNRLDRKLLQIRITRKAGGLFNRAKALMDLLTLFNR